MSAPATATTKKKKPPVTIREATMDDLDLVMSFENKLAEETEGKALDQDNLRRGVTLALQPFIARVFLAFLPNPDAAADSDEEKPEICVAFMATASLWSVAKGGFEIFILSVFVDAKARGAGVFRRFYELVAEGLKKDRLVTSLRLYVDSENTAAQATYQRLKMDFEDLRMWKWAKKSSELPAQQDDVVPHPEAVPIAFDPHGTAAPWDIRLMTAADIPGVCDLVKQSQLERGEEANDSALRRGVALSYAQPELCRIYVAELAEHVPTSPEDPSKGFFKLTRIVAYLIVNLELSEWSGGQFAWLSPFVIKSLRNKGVFSSLWTFAKDAIDKDPNVVGVRMQTSDALGERIARKIGLSPENYKLMIAHDEHQHMPLRERPIGSPTRADA